MQGAGGMILQARPGLSLPSWRLVAPSTSQKRDISNLYFRAEEIENLQTQKAEYHSESTQPFKDFLIHSGQWRGSQRKIWRRITEILRDQGDGTGKAFALRGWGLLVTISCLLSLSSLEHHHTAVSYFMIVHFITLDLKSLEPGVARIAHHCRKSHPQKPQVSQSWGVFSRVVPYIS